MARVTALQKAGKTTVAVELDGQPWRKLPHAVVLACELHPGLDLDRPKLRRLRAELRRFEALDVAAKLLLHRDLGAEQLQGELGRRQVAPSDQRVAIRALKRAGIVDDARLASNRARLLAERGYGDEAIRWKLEHVGLPEGSIEEALAALPPEPDRALAVAEREGVSPRTARLLARRGFGEDAVETACPSVAAGDESALGY
jgi:SOS response regulatory protein OraA/RecX